VTQVSRLRTERRWRMTSRTSDIGLFTPEMHQPHGILHGGVHCGVVETLASVGASLWLAERGYQHETPVQSMNTCGIMAPSVPPAL
jgi:hypothetical protein